jgi:hypothetical protein
MSGTDRPFATLNDRFFLMRPEAASLTRRNVYVFWDCVVLSPDCYQSTILRVQSTNPRAKVTDMRFRVSLSNMESGSRFRLAIP